MDVFNHSFRKLYIKTINNLDPGLNLPRSNKSPIKKKTAPLKSATGELIQNRARQMERWVQHYSEEEGALDAIKCHQVPSCAGGAWQWSKPWIVKGSRLPWSWQSSWKWQHPCRSPEVLKRKHHLWAAWNPLWREGEVPQDMRGANTVATQHKNKGDRRDCKKLPWHLPQRFKFKVYLLYITTVYNEPDWPACR